MRYQTESKGEFTYLLGEFLTGEIVTIALYDLSTGSSVALDSNSCTEIGSTGWFRWASDNITAPSSDKKEYLYIMTDSGGYTYSGKFVVGGYPDNNALETTAQAIKNKTDNLPASPAPADEYDSALAAIQADLDNPDQYKADVSGLAPAGEYDTEMARIDVSVSSRSSHSALDVWKLDSGSIDMVIVDKLTFGSDDFNLGYVLDYWKNSILRFTSGQNTNILREIELSTSTGGFTLREETPHPFTVGDTFVITPLFSFGSTREEAIADKDEIISEVNANEAKIDTIDTNVNEVLADTNELQSNQGNWLTATGFATQNPPSQNLDDYKADVSALALETTAQDIKAKTDTILWSDVQEILKLTGNKVTKSNDVITIYESDGVTVWKQYDLANGGRVEV